MLASSDKGGDAFLVFLSSKCTGGPARIAELEAAAEADHGQGYLLGRPEKWLCEHQSKSGLRLAYEPKLRKVATKLAS